MVTSSTSLMLFVNVGSSFSFTSGSAKLGPRALFTMVGSSKAPAGISHVCSLMVFILQPLFCATSSLAPSTASPVEFSLFHIESATFFFFIEVLLFSRDYLDNDMIMKSN